MQALIYLMKHSFRNRLKKALKKPVTYIFLIFGGAYAAMILYGWGVLAKEGGIDSAKWYIYILSLWMYFIICSNFISYARLKGVIFSLSHAHFIFPAPISPKIILIQGALKNFALNFLLSIVFALAGVTIFHVPPVKAAILFLVIFGCETLFEGSMIILLYAKEQRFEIVVKIICKCIYALIGVIVLIIFIYINKNGFSIAAVEEIFNLEALQLVPAAGWCVSAIRLIIMGPTAVNVTGTVLYLLCCAGLAMAAFRMQCTGAYYEDAAKFADDYAEMKSRSKKGEVVLSIGKKKKYKKARMEYKGEGAKAIFYRQFLEYKKEKFFIFGPMTIYSVIGVICCIIFIGKPENLPPGLALLGAIAYLIFLTSGYLGKWDKELANPYIYLIPDKPVKKLWYATLMEHVKSFVDGIVLVVPIGIFWSVPVFQCIFCILIYSVMQANRLYIKILGESLLGAALGKTGKGIFGMAVQGGILGVGIALAALMGVLINYNLVFPIIFIYSMIVTVLIAFLTAGRFETMEQWD